MIIFYIIGIAILTMGILYEDRVIEFEQKLLIKICKWVLKMAKFLGMEG